MTDWRSAKLDRIRELIREADPDSVEEVKWRKPSNPDGVPTWSHNGILCTGETYKDKVKLTFARALPSTIPPVCSTPAWTPERGARSTSRKATDWTKARSRR